jgi:putative SOS response-associated peptidase YedK
MCGRYTLDLVDLDEVGEMLSVERILVSDWAPRYNIAPSQTAPVVHVAETRTLAPMLWGFERHPGGGPGERLVINARVETLTQRPRFREVARCIVPASGYYEWRPAGPRRVPTWIHPRERGLLSLAGIWERDEQGHDRYAIVTCDATGFVRDIHSRMPLELERAQVDAWLDPNLATSKLLPSVREHARGVEHLTSHAVDRLVNSPANDVPACIVPVDVAPDRQLGLFGD